MDPRPTPPHRPYLLWAILAVVAANLAIAVVVLRSRHPVTPPTATSTAGEVSPKAGTGDAATSVRPVDAVPRASASSPPQPPPKAAAADAPSSPVLPAPGVSAGPALGTAKVSPKPSDIAAVALVVAKAGPGQIRGTVTLTGTPPPEKEIAAIKADRNCGALQPGPVFTRNYLVGTNAGLGNVFVRLLGRQEGSIPVLPREKPVLLDQVGCLYEPYMVGVMTNQPLVLRNSDPMMHNVNCTSKVGNPAFNIAQTRQGQEDTKFFTKPELFVTLQCNVHPWMFAYVGVVEHPFFAVTAADGSFEFPAGLPAGRYTLEFTHRKAGVVTSEVDVSAAKGAEVRVSMVAK